ncbi:hypothetical protein EYF80_014023 [Liparis tanakae]|uniref:Uncharacterized protein n=1 Tax=Liparis tanakae TaxID=230148 RepID=A0A4Z2ICJ3_9TELE|nr:hypothetical protein EYF80_014023 [Liparis tanakae]
MPENTESSAKPETTKVLLPQFSVADLMPTAIGLHRYPDRLSLGSLFQLLQLHMVPNHSPTSRTQPYHCRRERASLRVQSDPLCCKLAVSDGDVRWGCCGGTHAYDITAQLALRACGSHTGIAKLDGRGCREWGFTLFIFHALNSNPVRGPDPGRPMAEAGSSEQKVQKHQNTLTPSNLVFKAAGIR